MATTVGRFKLEAAERRPQAARRTEHAGAPAAPKLQPHAIRTAAPRIERRKAAAAEAKPTLPHLAAIRPKPKDGDGDWKEF
jgi:hypothetical protein